MATGYIGSGAMTTSTANQELIPSAPSDWTFGYKLLKVSFLNLSDCSIKINNGSPIVLKAYEGFSTEIGDAQISSFVVVESGTECVFIGEY